jgi:hypothetical protein
MAEVKNPRSNNFHFETKEQQAKNVILTRPVEPVSNLWESLVAVVLHFVCGWFMNVENGP